MHPRTEELLSQLDESRGVLRASVDSVPSSLHGTRPGPDRWSVAEVLEHLSRVEDGLTRLLASKLAEAKMTGMLEPEAESGPIADSIDRDRLLDRTRRIVAGERVQPGGGLDVTAGLEALARSREKLRDLIVAHDGLALGAITHPHPVLGVINGYQWFAFISAHESRHAAQIREIGDQLRAR
jgi:hypothetical protein